MSEPLSALAGEAAAGFVAVRETGPQGMVTLRGNLNSTKLKQAVKAATGHPVPKQRGMNGTLAGGVAWMSPDELMLFCAYDAAEDLAAKLGTELAGSHHLAVNVSDARSVFAIEGAGAREVIARLSPVDMAAGRFDPGMVRRTRLAQVPAAFWMEGPELIHLVAFRSVARYVFDLLKSAAKIAGPGIL